MTPRPTIIKRNRVTLEAVRRVPTASQLAPSAEIDCEQPKAVRTIEVGGRVQAIELTCSCGEITVIELDYQQSAPEAPTA